MIRMSEMVALATLALVATALAGDDAKVLSGSILRVDATGRTLSIAPADGGPGMAVDLEVSRKARIMMEGRKAGLDTLRVGQQVTVTFDAGLGVATAIEAAKAAKAATAIPEVVSLPELNTPGTENSLWPSPDGLTVYGVSVAKGADEGEIWSARRTDIGSLFGEKRIIARGRYATLSGDGLTLYLVQRRADGTPGDGIFVATRRTVDGPFGRPQQVPELKLVESPRNLALSADGLSLYFNHGKGEGIGLSVTVRDHPRSRWGAPRPLPVALKPGFEGNVLCPCITADGLTMIGVLAQPGPEPRPRFVAWTRKATDRPFSDPTPVELPDVKEFVGWSPRYVEDTGELFFCSQRLSPDGNMDLWLVKDFRRRPDIPPTARSFEGHTGTVLGVAFSPDGRTLATAGDTTVRLWDTSDAAEQAPIVLETMDSPTKGFIAVAFAPDGKTLAASRFDGGIVLWDVTASPAKLMRVLRKHAGPVVSIAFSPDGKTLASGGRDDGLLCFWSLDRPSITPSVSIPGEGGRTWSLAYSPDGTTLAEGVAFPPRNGSPVPGEIWMWDVSRRPYLRRPGVKVPRKVPRSLAYSPDGSRLAFGDGDVARIIDVRSGKSLGTFEGHNGPVASVAFTPDGKWGLSAGYDNMVRLWDATTMRQVHAFEGHKGAVEQAAVSPDGKLVASGGHDKAVRVWPLNPGRGVPSR